MELDRLDLAILEHLQANGRATAQELGEAAHLSPSPSHRRQKLLEEAGVIQRYVALLDQDKLGLPVNVFVSVKLANHQDGTLRGFERAVEACVEVMEVYEMTGASDYLLRIVAADIASYEAFLRGHLVKIPGVQSFESAMALKRVVSHEFAVEAGEGGGGIGCSADTGSGNIRIEDRSGTFNRDPRSAKCLRG